jgi:hypothetical protein
MDQELGTAQASHGKCPICKEVLGDDTVRIRGKGANGINRASELKGSTVVVSAGDEVHVSCRKVYTNPRAIERESSQSKNTPVTGKSLRSSTRPFNSKQDCFFCGIEINFHRAGNDAKVVKTDNFVNSILTHSKGRSDDWACDVRARIEYHGRDLAAAQCVYHQVCCTNFRSGLSIPLKFQEGPPEKRQKRGRKKNDSTEDAFVRLCTYIEQNADESLTFRHLEDKMNEYLDDETSAFNAKHLKTRLIDHFGERLFIAGKTGQADIVTLRKTTTQILRDYHMNAQDDDMLQKIAIIRTAGELIQNEIISHVKATTTEYPTTDSLKLESCLEFLPGSLRILLDVLMLGKNDQRDAAIGQAIVQAALPRVVAPLQIGLSVQLHHMFRSRSLIDVLNAMGFCSSYSEVLRFEKNAAASGLNVTLSKPSQESNLIFVGDNVDHNTMTIDGTGTFHGMGIIATCTPGKKIAQTIPRGKVSDIALTEAARVPIQEYRFAKRICDEIKFMPLERHEFQLKFPVDILWEVSVKFQTQVPGWNGMMHMMHQHKDHPGKSAVTFLPMINLYSGDKTCLLSTIEYVHTLASGQKSPTIITFDQPLYWKVCEILKDAPDGSHLKKVIPLLGCFHTFMNLLGAIGTLMEGSGLSTVLEAVYGENAVHHMMTGKAVSRAFRGHLLIDKCLNALLLEDLAEEERELVSKAEDAYTRLTKESENHDSILESSKEILEKLRQALENRRIMLSERSETSIVSG